jgi:hypothetical protein
MVSGQRFAVIAPVASTTGFVHATAAANISGALSTIDNAELNARPFMVAVPMQRWLGAYHDVPIGLQYTNAGGGRWQVRNESGASMPTGLSFNISAAPIFSNNAFRTTIPVSGVFEWRLEHPLLDNNPCAVVVAGRVDDPDVAGFVNNTTPFSLAYVQSSGDGAPGRWAIRAEGTGAPTFPANAAFNVIIDGVTSNRCRAPSADTLFANGFEP